MRYLIYPTRRVMQNSEIIQWARDRMMDDVLADAGIDVNADAESAMAYGEAHTPWPTLQEAIAKLEDDGVATFEA